MYIGQLARLTGASAKAIRHYEMLGLLGPVQRIGAYRIYSSRHVQKVKLIKQAQSLGFKLSELNLLGAARDNPDWTALAQLVARKRRDIALEIGRLQALDIQLQDVHQDILRCPELDMGAQPACTAP